MYIGVFLKTPKGFDGLLSPMAEPVAYLLENMTSLSSLYRVNRCTKGLR